ASASADAYAEAKTSALHNNDAFGVRQPLLTLMQKQRLLHSITYVTVYEL
ncbi:hypothetical protein H8E77_41300, partial [bacterium]|nr:hypothetical protein [bacterium]